MHKLDGLQMKDSSKIDTMEWNAKLDHDDVVLKDKDECDADGMLWCIIQMDWELKRVDIDYRSQYEGTNDW